MFSRKIKVHILFTLVKNIQCVLEVREKGLTIFISLSQSQREKL